MDTEAIHELEPAQAGYLVDPRNDVDVGTRSESPGYQLGIRSDPVAGCPGRAKELDEARRIHVGLGEAPEVRPVPELPCRDPRIAPQRRDEEVLEGAG